MRCFVRSGRAGLLPFLATLFFITGLAGCSGSSSPEPEPVKEVPPQTKVVCETSDNENDNDDCGDLLVGLTDAEGDFLAYQVNVTGIQLERVDGTIVSVLPSQERIDFAQYVEVSELVTAATVPAGVYVSGSISLDYADANILVEKAGEPASPQLVDENGDPLASHTFELRFDEGNRLVIARRRPALLELDFNLAASHQVDTSVDPVNVIVEPYITAEVDPITQKEFRLRGPLLGVRLEESAYRIAVRPFHRRDGRFGGVNIKTNDDTAFEIDGQVFMGADGLAQLATLDSGTATVSQGLFSRTDDRFVANRVLAGSSVPGSDSDIARGVVTARSGNQLTLQGVYLVRAGDSTGRQIDYTDQLMVTVAETTQVSKPRRLQETVSIADISVGQAVTILGDITISDSGESSIDASQGNVHMRLTYASGHLVDSQLNQLDLNLQALQGRAPESYDFSGTGMDETFDADPANYEISSEGLLTNGFELNAPVRVAGFVAPFGTAPIDFEAMSVIDYSDSRSQVYFDWPETDNVVSFSEINADSLVVNFAAEGAYWLVQGGIRTDLSQAGINLTMVAKKERGFYTAKTPEGVSHFSNFAEYTTYLAAKLEQNDTLDKLVATGGYVAGEQQLYVTKIAAKFN